MCLQYSRSCFEGWDSRHLLVSQVWNTEIVSYCAGVPTHPEWFYTCFVTFKHILSENRHCTDTCSLRTWVWVFSYMYSDFVRFSTKQCADKSDCFEFVSSGSNTNFSYPSKANEESKLILSIKTLYTNCHALPTQNICLYINSNNKKLIYYCCLCSLFNDTVNNWK
jgi:hypothetical protein